MENVEIFAIIGVVIAALSEIIALTPLKSNSVIQLVLSIAGKIFSVKKKWK